MKLSSRIKWKHVQRLYEYFSPYLKAKPIKIEQPEAGPVLVLSPHIDDEVIGAGGALRKHALAGDEITVVYFADCTPTRIAEAKVAADIMGFQQQIFFTEYESKQLANHAQIMAHLVPIIEQVKPKTVYLPAFFDAHNAHLAVNHILAKCHEQHNYTFNVCGFEVWTTLMPNLILNISDVIETKQHAIAANVSQTQDNDYVTAITSLNRYRAIVANRGTYAEGYLNYSMPKYYQLWKKIYG